MSSTNRLLSGGFVALSVIEFLAFCNIAVFFPFYSYLRTLPIAPKWLGLLIGAYAFSAMVVRPFISPVIHSGNARTWMFFSSIGFIAALPAYSLAHDFWSMLAVRILHGAFHAGLVSAMLAMVVTFIPKERSGQAFGLLSVNTLLPYALIPPVIVPLERAFGGFEHVLTAGAVVMLMNFPLLYLVKQNDRDADRNTGSDRGVSMKELLLDLRHPRVTALLVMTLLLYTAFTPVFFFIKGFGHQLGIGNPGLFFTVATLTMIALRVCAGSLFDTGSKVHLTVGALIWMSVGYIWLGFLTKPTSFYLCAFFLGIGWGVGMPVLNAMIFDCSEKRFRGLNINLSQEALQVGFLLGPIIGGWLVSGYNYRTLFVACAILTLIALAFLSLSSIRKEI